jgi:hypothetical protein
MSVSRTTREAVINPEAFTHKLCPRRITLLSYKTQDGATIVIYHQGSALMCAFHFDSATDMSNLATRLLSGAVFIARLFPKDARVDPIHTKLKALLVKHHISYRKLVQRCCLAMRECRRASGVTKTWYKCARHFPGGAKALLMQR